MSVSDNVGPIEDYVNFRAQATLSPEQYGVLVGVLTEWTEQNQKDPEAQFAIDTLKGIEFKRIQ